MPGVDFNDNGRLDAYDLGTLETLGELQDGNFDNGSAGRSSASAGDNATGCDIAKYGCLIPAFVLFALSGALAVLLTMCSG